MDEVEMVHHYLRGMNMEQLGRTDEAIELYEKAVDGRFDATGPYDRLIALYSHRGRHRDVMRVADAALQNVRTYDDKKVWYRRMRSEAEQAIQKVPRAIPKNKS
jgi:tetratricopeptide (TPR) repeat protein